MKLDKIREILNSYDEAIKRLITLRMSIIPLVAYTKMENNLPLFQPKREEEIYKKIGYDRHSLIRRNKKWNQNGKN